VGPSRALGPTFSRATLCIRHNGPGDSPVRLNLVSAGGYQHTNKKSGTLRHRLSGKLEFDLVAIATALTAAAAAAVTTTATTTATTAAATIFLGTRFVYVDSAAFQFLTVELADGFVALSIVRHFDEAETTGLARITIRYDADAIDLAKLFKKGANGAFSRAKA
jgi:hypothetical protein